MTVRDLKQAIEEMEQLGMTEDTPVVLALSPWGEEQFGVACVPADDAITAPHAGGRITEDGTTVMVIWPAPITS